MSLTSTSMGMDGSEADEGPEVAEVAAEHEASIEAEGFMFQSCQNKKKKKKKKKKNPIS